jgi:antibiotic biosynthesis monooxygenase (ABM) superfamily enzyme
MKLMLSNDEAAYTRALAKGDQTAARLRGYMGRGAFLRLDRGQLKALINRRASQEEIRAWFEEQGRRAVAQQAILDELEPELEG